MSLAGFVTFAHFTCQHRCALKDRTKENQSLGALDVGAKSTENGLFLASVTMPAEQLGEDVHRFASRNGRSKPDRAKLCATALGFDSPTRFPTSSDGPPLMTDASSPSTSLSCSRPKQAMLGSSTPPITSPPASPATATRNPSP